jgi:hypothetical protein
MVRLDGWQGETWDLEGKNDSSMINIVTCELVVGLRNRALLGSRPLNASRPNTRCATTGEAMSSPCRAELHRALLHKRPR